MALHHVFARRLHGAIKKMNSLDSNPPPMNLGLSTGLSSSLEAQSPHL